MILAGVMVAGVMAIAAIVLPPHLLMAYVKLQNSLPPRR
jgi:hypothetical protein